MVPKIVLLHLSVVPQLSSGRQHNYWNKTRPAGCASEQPTYSLVFMGGTMGL